MRNHTFMLDTETELEKRIAGRLRKQCVDVIERLGEERSAQLLDLAPSGVARIVWHTTWSMERAVRVAVALGVLTEQEELR